MQTVISFWFSYSNISKKQQPKKTTLILETILSSCKTYTNDFLLSVIASLSLKKTLKVNLVHAMQRRLLTFNDN